MAMVRNFTELRVYSSAFNAAMQIYRLTKSWPAEERYSLTDQIRRSSRSVCGNIAEAWRKRRYPAAFVSKLTDSDGECAEAQNWLKFAGSCDYLAADEVIRLWALYDQVSAGLVDMMVNADRWCGPHSLARESPVMYDNDDKES